ncbi:hypothetical protein [Hymenobacter sp.]|jgi:hypothetical protein|uniref:hypothetical protein n=1 Tax=Hymenobacter sp. TaxID=1898978 RepID=UPI002ED94F50
MLTPLLITPPVTTYVEYLNLSYRPDLRMVVLRWLRDASLPELQAAHQAALELALRHSAVFWFIDVRRRQVVNNTHTRWVADEFLPYAAALLPSNKLRIAYFTSPGRQHITNSDPEMQLTIMRAQSPSQPYRLRSFLDEASAMAWLLDA